MDKSAVDALVAQGHAVDTNHYDGDALVEHMRASDVIVIRSATKIRKDLIDQVKDSRLKLMIRAGVGMGRFRVQGDPQAAPSGPVGEVFGRDGMLAESGPAFTAQHGTGDTMRASRG